MKAGKFLAIAICMAVLAVTASLPVSSHAATITLDFGTTTNTTFNDNLLMQFTGVATGINAELTADAVWSAGGETTYPHGGVLGDIRVNASSPESIVLTLSLYDGNVSGGFSQLWNPTGSDWNLNFYDIDSNDPATNPPNGSNWDEVTLLTPGTYTVTGSTALNIDTTVPGQVTFSGAGAGNVDGQGGISSPITQAQADVAVLYNVVEKNSVQFVYTVGEAVAGSYRNLLIDGGSLNTATCSDADGNDCGFLPPANVPIPGAALLLGSGLIGLVAIRRRARK